MSDLIDRQAAIDALGVVLQANGYSNVALVSELNRSIGYLRQLPSAQPEIVRCKDCRYYDAHECKHPRALIFSEDDDFCSHAERRKDD